MISNVSCKFSSFGDYSSFKYNSANVRKMMDGMGDAEGLMPSIAQCQVGFTASQNGFPVPEIENRVALMKDVPLNQIMICPERLDVLSIAGNVEGYSEQYARQDLKTEQLRYHSETFELLSDIVPKATRIALFGTFFCFELEEEQKKDIRKKFINDAGYFSEKGINTFSVRLQTSDKFVLAGSAEQINVICSVHPDEINFGGRKFPDGFAVDFDINTSQGNMTPRFQGNAFSDFYEQSLDLALHLKRELL